MDRITEIIKREYEYGEWHVEQIWPVGGYEYVFILERRSVFPTYDAIPWRFYHVEVDDDDAVVVLADYGIEGETECVGPASGEEQIKEYCDLWQIAPNAVYSVTRRETVHETLISLFIEKLGADIVGWGENVQTVPGDGPSGVSILLLMDVQAAFDAGTLEPVEDYAFSSLRRQWIPISNMEDYFEIVQKDIDYMRRINSGFYIRGTRPLGAAEDSMQQVGGETYWPLLPILNVNVLMKQVAEANGLVVGVFVSEEDLDDFNGKALGARYWSFEEILSQDFEVMKYGWVRRARNERARPMLVALVRPYAVVDTRDAGIRVYGLVNMKTRKVYKMAANMFTGRFEKISSLDDLDEIMTQNSRYAYRTEN